MHTFWVMYILGLRSSPRASRVCPSWSPSEHLLTLALSPFGEPALEATFVRRRLFIVLMTAALISRNLFSLQAFLSNVQWISHYNTWQWHIYILYITFIHTFISLCYTSHSCTFASSSLPFFVAGWLPSASRVRYNYHNISDSYYLLNIQRMLLKGVLSLWLTAFLKSVISRHVGWIAHKFVGESAHSHERWPV